LAMQGLDKREGLHERGGRGQRILGPLTGPVGADTSTPGEGRPGSRIRDGLDHDLLIRRSVPRGPHHGSAACEGNWACTPPTESHRPPSLARGAPCSGWQPPCAVRAWAWAWDACRLIPRLRGGFCYIRHARSSPLVPTGRWNQRLLRKSLP
jgi:hypothetical protein